MKMKRMILALAAVLAFGFIGCNNHTCPIHEHAAVHPDLQRALTWVNSEDRRLATANGVSVDIPFEGSFADTAIRGGRTFVQFATHALLDAWIDTYQNNRGAWNETAWKRIVSAAVNTNNSEFSSTEIPLIISKGAEQYNAVKNPLGEYMS